MTTPNLPNAQKLKAYELYWTGQAIFKPNQLNETPYVVVEGEVAVYEGEELVETRGPGQFLNDLRLTPAKNTTVIAKTNCLLIALDEKMLAALEPYPPDFVVEIMQVMVERLTRRVLPPLQRAIRRHIQPVGSRIPRPREAAITFSLAQLF